MASITRETHPHTTLQTCPREHPEADQSDEKEKRINEELLVSCSFIRIALSKAIWSFVMDLYFSNAPFIFQHLLLPPTPTPSPPFQYGL